MAYFDREMEDIGRSIQDIVDRAVNAGDFKKLNKTIRETVNKAVDIGSETVRRASDAARYTTVNRPSPVSEVKQAEVVPKKEITALYAKTGTKTTAGILKTVSGAVLGGSTLLSMLTSLLLNLLIPEPGAIAGIVTIPKLLALGIGGGLLVSGISQLGKIGRFKTYCRVLGQKTHCSLDKLANSVGRNAKTVRRELQKMINEGLFLEGHMDREQTMLITSDETYNLFEQSRLRLEQQQREREKEKAEQQLREKAHSVSPQVQEVLDRGDAFVAQIRKCNDAIPGEEISGKIDRIERIVARIFDRAEEHPEIVPDLKKLMDYYLPMTVKLLNAYADMDAQPVQGENIRKSKREIEATLDTLNVAFEKLLDDLFVDTAIDVSSDISVLNTLLAQEGLTDDGISNIGK